MPEAEQAQALRGTKATGRPCAVTPEQYAALAGLVERGAQSLGFSGDVWTAARVRSVARCHLRLRVGLTTIKKFLHRAGFSVQKPHVKAVQQDESAVACFRSAWAAVKKKRAARV